MQGLFDKIGQYISLNNELKDILHNSFKRETIERNTLVINRNKVCRKLYFIESGFIRSYFYNNGKERTYWFYNENNFFTSWYSFYTGFHSFEDMETVEKTTLYSIEKGSYNELLRNYTDLATFSRLFTEEQYATVDFLAKRFLDISAKEKYELLLFEMPDLELRAKLQDIASLLGISKETLSRIRNEKYG